MVNNQSEGAAKILAMLDQYAEAFDFPMPNNIGFYYSGMRLSVFRSQTEWLIVFDEIVYDLGLNCFDHLVLAYGDHLERLGLQESWNVLPHIQITLQDVSDVVGEERLLDRYHFTLTFNGKCRNFDISADDYRAAGIGSDNEMPIEAQVLRYLVHEVGDALFAGEGDLLQVCGRADCGLEVFLRLRDWHHPDLVEEKPSSKKSFRMLAEAIANQNADLYQPCEPFNTHWSNWKHP